MAKHILSTGTRLSVFKTELVSPPPPSLCQSIKRYTQLNQDDDHVIGERARSTADEFTRVAKEKAEAVTDTVKDAWEGAKEAKEPKTDSDTNPQSAKQKFKETVEKGNYDNIGKE
ncbi:hypothetical protein ACHQM5_017190 [Ranunculus cassubicifolius]